MNMRTAAALLRTHWRRLAIMALSLAAAGAFVALFPAAHELEAQLHAVAAAPAAAVLPAIALLVFGQLARAWRWQGLLGWERRVPLLMVWRELLSAQLLNWLLPVRAGELTRVARMSGGPAPVSAMWVAATVVMEKVADSLVLAVIALGAASAPAASMWMRVFLLMAGGVLAAVSVWTARRAGLAAWMSRRFPGFVARAVGEDPAAGRIRTQAMRQPLRWLTLAALSAVIWVAGLLTNVVLANGLDVVPGWPAHAALLVALQAGSAVAALPANLGLFPIAAQVSFSAAGVPESRAVAFGAVLYVLVYGVNVGLWLIVSAAAALRTRRQAV